MLNTSGKHSIISIILPFKDEAAYLTACIQSIIDQTYPNWELLLVDDHSTDASSDMARQFAKNDARIRYFVNPASGVIEAMKYGFEQSTGALITRMDGDDIKSPDNLEQLIAQVAPGVMAVGQVRYFRDDGLGKGYAQYEDWINSLTKSNNSFEEVYKECVIPSPCWLVYRSDFIKAGGFDSDKYPEDYDLCFRFYRAGLKTKGTEGVIHFWRDHAIRTTRTSPHYADNRFMALKLHYFQEIDYDSTKELVLWGAGKKGKQVAQHWIENGWSFAWLTDNPNKIGHNIYGVVLQDSASFPFSLNQQVVITVANKSGQEEIKGQLANFEGRAFWFC